MVVVIICIKTSKTDRRLGARASTRGSGDAPAGLWALSPGRSRSWSRRAAPGSPSLQTARFSLRLLLLLHTASRSLSAFPAPSLHPSKVPHHHHHPGRSVGRSDGCGSTEAVRSLIADSKGIRCSSSVSPPPRPPLFQRSN